MPLDAYVVAAICVDTFELSSSCFKKSIDEISPMMAMAIGKQYIDYIAEKRFLLRFPEFSVVATVARFLLTLEFKTIDIVQEKLIHDLDTARSFQWPTEQQQNEALRVIEADGRTVASWNRQAREEAQAGSNWHLIEFDANTEGYMFEPGRAYDQLKTIHSIGWSTK